MIIEQEDYVYIAAIVLQVGLLVYFVRRALLARKAKKRKPSVAASPVGNSYEHTRNLALQVTPQQLGLTISPSAHKVYGVVMDWDMTGTVLTLSAYITGAANVAMSSGTVLTGIGKNPAVADLASTFVQLGQEYLGRTLPIANTGMPPWGTIRFYLLTNHGLYAGQEQLASINDNSSPWLPLFFRGNMIIDEIKAGAN